MIYPSLGISILAHIIIIVAVKTKSFLGFKESRKNARMRKGILSRIFVSFAIAAVIEFVLFFVILSSIVIVDAGVKNHGSNIKTIQSAVNDMIEKNAPAENSSLGWQLIN